MTQHTRPVLVLGATGGQGGAVVDALLDRAVPVRALVRNPESDAARHLGERGVEVVAGQLDDTASLTSAMDEVSSVFAVTTPFESGPEAEVRQGRAILAAVRSAQVPHLVFSSVAGAHQHSGVPHFDSKAEIERDLVESGVPCTILGPTYFFDNALGGEREIRDGVLELPLPPDRALQQIARADLGRIGAEILIAPEKFVGRRIELAGDQPTPRAMAAALGEALGHPVRHTEVLLDTIEDPDMHAMWTFLRGDGYRVDLPALHAEFPHVGWTSFAEWATDTLEAR